VKKFAGADLFFEASVTEDELIAKIKLRAADPELRVTMFPADQMFPPAGLETVRAAEVEIGFKLPNLLVRLYVEVGNGGFGPGYGIYGIKGGHADDIQDLTLENLYLSDREYEWPERIVNICDWGCTMGSLIDCSTPEGQMVYMGDGSPVFMPEGITFAQWMEDWVNGVDLFDRVYKRYQKHDRPSLPDAYRR
jgi:hypothetical protein